MYYNFRCPPRREWIECVAEWTDATFEFKDYNPEKDYMFRVKAYNEYGTSDPSMSTQLFAKPRKFSWNFCIV